MPSGAPEASVVVLSYNSSGELPGCLDGLRRQTHLSYEVVLVDNASTDGSVGLVAERFPEVKVVESAVNAGYAGGCNLGFRCARGRFLAVLGPDCVPEPGWLEALVDACRRPDVGLATSMVRLRDQPDRVNVCGNDVHLLGMGFCHGYDDPWQSHLTAGDVASISGCAFAVRRDVLDRIGPFDEAFFMYCEDTDLSLRTWLAGLRVVFVPASVAYHAYRLEVHPLKFHLIERNRYQVLVKNLGSGALLALLPSLLLGEALMWAYALLHGPRFVRSKIRAWGWLIGNRRMLRERAGEARRRDAELLRLLAPRLSERQILPAGGPGRIAGDVVNLLFSAWLRVARALVR